MLLSALQTVQKRRKREINYVMSGTKRENETDESQKLLQTKGRTLPWYSDVRFVCFWSAPTYPKCLISLGVVRTRLARGKARRPEIGKRSVSPTHVPSLFPPPPPPSSPPVLSFSTHRFLYCQPTNRTPELCKQYQSSQPIFLQTPTFDIPARRKFFSIYCRPPPLKKDCRHSWHGVFEIALICKPKCKPIRDTIRNYVAPRH